MRSDRENTDKRLSTLLFSVRHVSNVLYKRKASYKETGTRQGECWGVCVRQRNFTRGDLGCSKMQKFVWGNTNTNLEKLEPCKPRITLNPCCDAVLSATGHIQSPEGLVLSSRTLLSKAYLVQYLSEGQTSSGNFSLLSLFSLVLLTLPSTEIAIEDSRGGRKKCPCLIILMTDIRGTRMTQNQEGNGVKKAEGRLHEMS